jgi:ribonuclease E
VKNGVGSAGTHAITEDVRNALARVAASTIHADEAQASTSEPRTAADAPAAVIDPLSAVLEALPEPPAAGQGRTRRRRAATKTVVTPPSAD